MAFPRLSKKEYITPYSELALIYDDVMDHVDYEDWADYVHTIFVEVEKISGNDEDLSNVRIEITSGSKIIKKYISPFYANGIAGPPKAIRLLFPKGEHKDGKIIFTTAGGVTKVSELSDGVTQLFDIDWQGN